MEPKVLVGTIIGPSKQYCSGFLLRALQGIQGAGYYTVLDGAGWMPEGLPGDVEQLSEDAWATVHPGLYGRQARMRERVRQVLLAGDWTHVYFHDVDMVAPQGVLEGLLAHDVPMASAIYNNRLSDTVSLPATPMPMLLNTPSPFHFLGFGMGAMLLRRDVLTAIAFQSAEPGEDFGFCTAATAAGFGEVLVDGALSCWHVRDDGTANRVSVASQAPGVVWTDLPHYVSNRFGSWVRGVARHDLTPEQVATLPPGFANDDYARLTVEVRPLNEISF